MIKGTVALPVWKSKRIAWLCMESLCRLHAPEGQWELIVFEEVHNEALGECFFKSYDERLKEIGCKQILYLSTPDKWPLSKKWIMISLSSHPESQYFCLCATDNYYSPYMLIDAERDIKKADWIITTKGFFYDFYLDKLMRFDYPSLVGLQMIARTEKVRQFPMDVVNKGVDMWFSRQMGTNVLINDLHWKHILCTNGLNTISTERINFFKEALPPYYETKMNLDDIVPDDIANQIKELCLKLQLS